VVDSAGWGLTYFYVGGSPLLTDVQSLADYVAGTITAIPTGGSLAPGSYLGPTISTVLNIGNYNVYDISNHLDGTPHGSPIYTHSYTAGPGGSLYYLPEGVCAVITLQAPYGTDVEFGPGTPPTTRPRARDRGRIYFGPVNQRAISAESGTNRSVIGATCAGDLTKWIKAINVHTVGSGGQYQLGVWSRKNAAVKPLTEVWVDDRPDYQRRRTDQGVIRYSLPLP